MARRKRPTPAERWEQIEDAGELFALLTGDGKRTPTAAAFQRKLRLLDAGRAWRGLHDVPVPELREPMAVTDRMIDGQAKPAEVRAARAAINRVAAGAKRAFRVAHRDGTAAAKPANPTLKRLLHAVEVAEVLLDALGDEVRADADHYRWSLLIPYSDWKLWEQRDDDLYPVGEARLVGLVRDLFGNPFTLAAFDPRWQTTAVAGLTRTIYDGRAFDRLPVLADALEEGGCADATILAHCRGGGEHIRGCWVLDGLLDRNHLRRA